MSMFVASDCHSYLKQHNQSQRTAPVASASLDCCLACTSSRTSARVDDLFALLDCEIAHTDMAGCFLS